MCHHVFTLMVKRNAIPAIIYILILGFGIWHIMTSLKQSKNVTSPNGRWTEKEWETDICQMRTNQFVHPFAFRDNVVDKNSGSSDVEALLPIKLNGIMEPIKWWQGTDAEALNVCAWKGLNTFSRMGLCGFLAFLALCSVICILFKRNDILIERLGNFHWFASVLFLWNMILDFRGAYIGWEACYTAMLWNVDQLDVGECSMRPFAPILIGNLSIWLLQVIGTIIPIFMKMKEDKPPEISGAEMWEADKELYGGRATQALARWSSIRKESVMTWLGKSKKKKKHKFRALPVFDEDEVEQEKGFTEPERHRKMENTKKRNKNKGEGPERRKEKGSIQTSSKEKGKRKDKRTTEKRERNPEKKTMKVMDKKSRQQKRVEAEKIKKSKKKSKQKKKKKQSGIRKSGAYRRTNSSSDEWGSS